MTGVNLSVPVSAELLSAFRSLAPVTLTSSAPSVALLSIDRNTPGTTSITFDKTTKSAPQFYIQGQSAGTAVLTISVAGFSSAVTTITVNPSGIIFASGNIEQTTSEIGRQVGIQPAILDSHTLAVQSGCLSDQSCYLNPGASIAAVAIASSNPAAGLVSGSGSVLLTGGANSGFTTFQPIMPGTTNLTIQQPAGFIATTTTADAQITATVDDPAALSPFALTSDAPRHFWAFNAAFASGTYNSSYGYGLITQPNNAALRIAGCGESQWQSRTLNPLFPPYWTCHRAHEPGPYTVQTLTGASWIKLLFHDCGGAFRVLVDGIPTSYYMNTPVSPCNGVPLEWNLQLDGKPHRIAVEAANGAYFGGFVSPNGASDFVSPDIDLPAATVVMGDSFTEPTILSYTNPATGAVFAPGGIGWAQSACATLGLDCLVSGLGSTGYSNPGTAGRVKFLDRVEADVCEQNPALVITAGGINDSGEPYLDTLESDALAYYEAVAACPSHPAQLVLGPWGPNGSASQPQSSDYKADLLINSAVAAAQAEGIDIRFAASPLREMWVTGSRTNCTQISLTNNACWVTGADGTHPTQPGHDYLGARAAASLLPEAASLPMGPGMCVTGPNCTPISWNGAAQSPSQANPTATTGTINYVPNARTLTGNGTHFTTELKPGYAIMQYPPNSQAPLVVQSIASDTQLTVVSNPLCCSTYSSTFEITGYPMPAN